MGRKRKSNPLNLPERVYPKGNAFYYHHRPDEKHKFGRWEKLGADVLEAKKRAALIEANIGEGYGKVPYWLTKWLESIERRVKVGKLKPRTLSDYRDAVDKLGAWFADFVPAGVEPGHIGDYLDKGVELDRAVRANREKAAFSAFFSWMMRAQEARSAGVKSNPCAGVHRNPEKPRERYVEDSERDETLACAPVQVWGLAHLVYRTLQRPEDILTWTPRNITERRRPDGTMARIIRNDQGKTGVIVDIEITPEIDAILARLKVPMARRGSTKVPSKVVTGLTIIHRRDGRPYTYDGLCGMLKRAAEEVRDLHAIKRGPLEEMPSWGFYDMKGKGATDMWQSGVDLTLVQVLCGHKSIKTTEKYVKARWHGIVMPNRVGAAV